MILRGPKLHNDGSFNERPGSWYERHAQKRRIGREKALAKLNETLTALNLPQRLMGVAVPPSGVIAIPPPPENAPAVTTGRKPSPNRAVRGVFGAVERADSIFSGFYCVVCHTPFTPKGHGRRQPLYCSSRCNSRAAVARQREKTVDKIYKI